MMSAQEGKLKVVKYLVDHGADMNAENQVRDDDDQDDHDDDDDDACVAFADDDTLRMATMMA